MSKTKLPTGWSKSRIGDVVEDSIEQGLPEDKHEFTYIDISAVDNRRKEIVEPKVLPIASAPSRARQQVKRDDVLVSTTRPNLNAVALVSPQLDGAIASTGFAVLRPVLLEARWLFSVVQSEDFVAEMSALVKGALYPAIRPGHVHDYVMPVPPLAEQKQITSKLANLLKRTRSVHETLEALPELIQQYRAAVLEAACTGRLVPTEAELARKEQRDFEPASTLLERILIERRAKWETNQLAKMRAAGKGPKDDKWKERYKQPLAPLAIHDLRLPQGWTWASVEQCSYVIQYGTSAKTNDLGDGIPVLRMGNIFDGRLRLEELRFLPKSHSEFPELLLQKGDVLFNRTNSAELVGKSAVFRESGRFSFASYLIRLRFLDGCIPEFVSFLINSSLGRRWVASVAGQVTNQANISGAKLAALAIPLPPVAEQRRIVAQVVRRLAALDRIELQVSDAFEQTAKLRASFFNRALSGKLVRQTSSNVAADRLLAKIRFEKEMRKRVMKKKIKVKQRLWKDPLLAKAMKVFKGSLVEIHGDTKPRATLNTMPNDTLSQLLAYYGKMPAQPLWQLSGLAIDDFYSQLKTEMGKTVREVGTARELEAIS